MPTHSLLSPRDMNGHAFATGRRTRHSLAGEHEMTSRVSHALLGALSVSLSLSLARADDGVGRGPPLETTASPAHHGNYGGRRPWLDPLSSKDQTTLAKLILQYTATANSKGLTVV